MGERFLSPGIIALVAFAVDCHSRPRLHRGVLEGPLAGAVALFRNSTAAVAITAAVGLVLLTIAIIRRHSVERRVTIFVSGAGLIAGGLAAEEVLFDAIQN